MLTESLDLVVLEISSKRITQKGAGSLQSTKNFSFSDELFFLIKS